MNARQCDMCRQVYVAKRITSRYCSTKCRTAATRARQQGAEVISINARPVHAGPLAATRAELEAAGVEETSAAVIALNLAARLESATDAAAVAIARELRAAIAEALSHGSTEDDAVDDWRARRDAIRDRATAG